MVDPSFGDRYTILKRLGEGGMATVFLAKDTALSRLVAIKALRPQFAGDASVVERFSREAKAVANLSHPNIVAIYDVGEHEGLPFIVMEFVEGGTLKELIGRRGALGSAEAVSIIDQVLGALGYAHAKGVVHRDIKPQNILISTNGVAKVTDFGIARAAHSSQMTDTGMVLGTVHYASPEQLQGQQTTPASDLYSAGVVLYEMLTGSLPFDGEGPVAVALKHVQESPVSPRAANSSIPDALEAVVLRAMSKNVADRYASTDDMRADLRNVSAASAQSTAAMPAVSPASAQSTGALPTVSGAAPAKQSSKRRVDWVTVVLALLIVGAILVWIPLGKGLYGLFVSVPTSVVTTVTPRPVTPTTAPVSTVAPTKKATEAKMPNLEGLPFSEAERQVNALGLDLRILREEFSETYDLLAIISQKVEAGTQVAVGTTIDVVVSKGRERVVVPYVVGMSSGSAVSMLRKAGLNPLVIESFSSGVQAGVVIQQEPASGKTVQGGSPVTVWVSKGSEPAPGTPTRITQPTPFAPTPAASPTQKNTVTVPNLVGLAEAEAQRRIAAAGLGTTYPNWQTAADVADKTFFNSIPVGCVLSQQPPPGSEVAPGTTVSLAVRKE